MQTEKKEDIALIKESGGVDKSCFYNKKRDTFDSSPLPRYKSPFFKYWNWGGSAQDIGIMRFFTTLN